MARRYYWWETFLTNHQSYTTAELARIANVTIDVLCVEQENAIRRNQGWTIEERAELRLRPFPRRWVRFVWDVIRSDRDAVHVFAGPFGSYRLTLAAFLAVLLNRSAYLLTEPYSPIAKGYLDDDATQIVGVMKSKMRPLLYWLYGLMFKRRIKGVFAISPLAIVQLLAMGVPREKIFPFAYFVPSTPLHSTRAVGTTPLSSRVIFVGTLNLTKGVDVLVAAARVLRARGAPISMDVYDYGNKERFGLDSSTVKYCGLIPFGEAQGVIQGYDLLVLPSRYDGWGVVVNEAVLSGVPVVCSSSVGASAMVKAWGCGVVYEGGSEALADALQHALGDPERLEAMREACRRLQPMLSPAVGGRYLFDVISGHAASHYRVGEAWY